MATRSCARIVAATCGAHATSVLCDELWAPTDEWDGVHFSVIEKCCGPYCGGRDLHERHYKIERGKAEFVTGRVGVGWQFFVGDVCYEACMRCAEVGAFRFIEELATWSQDEHGLGILGVLSGAIVDEFKTTWQPRYPLHDWVFTRLVSRAIEQKYEGFRIERSVGERLGFEVEALRPMFERVRDALSSRHGRQMKRSLRKRGKGGLCTLCV